MLIEKGCLNCIDALSDVDIALPYVNWSVPLNTAKSRNPRLFLDLLVFASKHSILSISKSLTAFFESNLLGAWNEFEEGQKFLVSPDGVGKILELSGFSKSGDDASSPLISHTQCLELCQKVFLLVLNNSADPLRQVTLLLRHLIF